MEMKAEKHDKKSGEIYMMKGRTQFRQTGSQEYQSSDWFKNLHESNYGHVVLCDNSAYTVAGIGDVTLKFDTGFVYTLNDVRFIPELSRNLISVGQLERIGFTGKIGNGMLKLMKGALVTCKGTRRNEIYLTTGEVIRGLDSSISSTKIDYTHKWHNRLAHVSIKGLKLLNDKNIFGKDCVSDLSFCDHCVLGKHHKLPFSTGVHKTNGILDYVHSDLWGPASYPEGVNGYRLWDRSQKGGKVIVSRDVTFNEFEMPCLGPNLEKLGGDQQEDDSRQLETIKVSTHIPSTSSEMETQIQQPDEEDEEAVIEDHHVEEDPLVDYQLARDR
ncbi:CCHC-type domain-containing protein [Abeliophyllum distichum]|uniref:CCHC-type domain-containing protein n=1 Tax=Abeliophyllum distichum TaxID=126358 RepID=A0ABD1RRU7_9LAMI